MREGKFSVWGRLGHSPQSGRHKRYECHAERFRARGWKRIRQTALMVLRGRCRKLMTIHNIFPLLTAEATPPSWALRIKPACRASRLAPLPPFRGNAPCCSLPPLWGIVVCGQTTTTLPQTIDKGRNMWYNMGTIKERRK